MDGIFWVATLSNGEEAIQDTGKFRSLPGERNSWVKMCEFCQWNKLHLDSLKLVIPPNEVMHLTPDKGRFALDSIEPDHYSLCFHLEADDLFGQSTESHFIDLAAHYDGFTVHTIRSLGGNECWVLVTQGTDSMAPSPSRNGSN